MQIIAMLKNSFTEIISGDQMGAALIPGDEIIITGYIQGCSDPGCCESEIEFIFDGNCTAVGSIYADKIIIGQKTLADIMREK